MKTSVDSYKHDRYLGFALNGAYDLGGLVKIFEQILDACKYNDIYKVLVDYYGLEGDGGGIEKTLHGLREADSYSKYIKKGGHDVKIACYGPKNGSYKPGDSARNKSDVNFQLFEKITPALQWLGIESA